MSRPGARVEDLTPDRVQRDQSLHYRLWTADIPRRGGRQAVCDPVVAVHLLEAGGIVGIELRCHVSPFITDSRQRVHQLLDLHPWPGEERCLLSGVPTRVGG